MRLTSRIAVSRSGYITVSDAEDWQGALRFVREGYEPLLALGRIRTPFLAIYGGRDVPLPAWRSAQESGDALDRAGNPDAIVVVFPHGDHRIMDAETAEFVVGYLDLLANWVVRQIS